MFRRGPTWDTYNDALERANKAEEENAVLLQREQDLLTENKRVLTETVDKKEAEVTAAKYVNGLGKYMVPIDGTLEGHFGLIFDRKNELDFWPEQSPAFDGLIAQTFLSPAFSNSNHPDYFDYESLRDNCSLVRNYLLQVVLNGVDTKDMEQLRIAEQKLEEMGREVGVALQRDSMFKRPGSASLSVIEASEPGAGAAKIYELLFQKQQRADHMAPLKKIFGYDYSEWGLPDIERSPFSEANVKAFPSLAKFKDPQAGETQATTEQPQEEPAPQELEASPAQQLSAISAALSSSAISLHRVHALAPPVKERSVELARQILENMRVNFGDTDRDQWLEMPPDAALVPNDSLRSVAEVYAETYQAALAMDPLLQNEPLIQQSNEAVGKLAYMMKQQAAMKLVDEGLVNDAMDIMREIEQYPESWKQNEGITIGNLLAQLQSGLEMSFRATQISQHKGLAPLANTRNAQFEQLVQGIPTQDLAAMRNLRNEAAAMPMDPAMQLRSYAKEASRLAANPSSSPLEQSGGSHRAALKQQKLQAASQGDLSKR